MRVLVGIVGTREGADLTGRAGNIQTEVQVEPEVFETVDLVVELGVADETVGLGLVAVGEQHVQRVGSSQAGGGESGAAAGTIVEITVGGRVIDRTVRIAEIRVEGRVVERGRSNGAAVGLVLMGDDALAVEVHGQMVVQELRAEGEVERTLVVQGCLQGTFLAKVADGEAVRQPLAGAVDAQVVLLGLRDAEDLTIPVCIGRTQLGSEGIAVGRTDRIGLGHVVAELVGGHDVEPVGIVAEAEAAVVGDLRFAGVTLLGGNDDNAVGGTGTVDRRGGRILEDREALDVVGVDGLERVGHTLAAVDRQRNAVDDDERVVGRIQGSGATDTDRRSAARTAVTRDDLQTSDLALEHVLGRDDRAPVEFFGLNGGDGTGHVIFLDGTVTDDHDVVKELGVLRQGDGGGHFGGLEDLACIADAADLDHSIGGLDSKDVVTVETGRGSVRSALFDDGGTDDRTRGVDDDTLNLIPALGEYGGGNQTCETDCHCG